MAKKIRLKRKIVEALDLPMETAFDVPRITLVGDGEMLVENHKGIHEYYPSHVRLLSGCGTLKISGEELSLRELSTERLMVSGKIIGLEYENKV